MRHHLRRLGHHLLDVDLVEWVPALVVDGLRVWRPPVGAHALREEVGVDVVVIESRLVEVVELL